jgi:hypothetical protein
MRRHRSGNDATAEHRQRATTGIGRRNECRGTAHRTHHHRQGLHPATVVEDRRQRGPSWIEQHNVVMSVRRALVCAGFVAGAAMVFAACGPATHSATPSPRNSASAVPSSNSSPSDSPGVGCLSQAQAQAVWTNVNNRLDAIELDPKHAGVADVATGSALDLINQYLQQNLEAHGFTEKEVDRLDSLSVVDAGCGTGPLVVDVTVTVVTDNYYRADGTLDHADPAVGTSQQLRETLVRFGPQWRESDFEALQAPGQTPISV